MHRVLVVDDDEASARTLELHLRSQGLATEVASDAESGLAQAGRWRPELVILDIRMPGRSGLEALPDFKALPHDPHVVMITAFHDMESTIEAMQKGAEDYIHKPIDIDELDPQSVEEAGQFDIHRYRLSVTGHYDELGAFLADIASLPRIMVPYDLTLGIAPPIAQASYGDTTGSLLQAQFILRTFVKPPSTGGIGAGE